jgi:RimJ/RimL family protein N-acetyltransferase
VEILHGERVTLRPFRAEDAPEVVRACDDEVTQRFLTQLPHPYTLDDARSWIDEGSPAAFAAGGWAYAVAEPATDKIIGGAGGSLRGRHGAEIGYWVAPWARGRGIATEAARVLTAHAFATGRQRVELRTHPENVASQRVALAAGFSREGVARGAGHERDGTLYDQIVWGRLATDPGEPMERLLPDLPGGLLTDGVVTLRPVTSADIEDIFVLDNLPECVARSVPPVPPSREEVERRCRLAMSKWLAGERASFTIRDAASDAFAGTIGVFNPEASTGQAMIGYNLAREWRGRGMVTRAVNLVVDWAFRAVGLVRVIAGVAPDNAASHAVLSRAGFEQEGYQRARLPGPDGTRVDDVQWVRIAG